MRSASLKAHRRHEFAGLLLEEVGASAEALAAYCRAEAWPRVRTLLGGHGERLADGGPAWVETLPPAIVRHDPWLGLAAARRARSEGRWTAALDAYTRTEAAFGEASTAMVCRRERLALAAWLDPVAIAPNDWTGLLRAGLVRQPLAAAREADRDETATASLARGLLELVAGEINDARIHLARALALGTGTLILDAVTRLAVGIAALLAGDVTVCQLLDDAVDHADRAGASWLARLGRAARRIAPGAVDDGMAAAEAAFAEERDPWGGAILAMLEAWAPMNRRIRIALPHPARRSALRRRTGRRPGSDGWAPESPRRGLVVLRRSPSRRWVPRMRARRRRARRASPGRPARPGRDSWRIWQWRPPNPPVPSSTRSSRRRSVPKRASRRSPSSRPAIRRVR